MPCVYPIIVLCPSSHKASVAIISMLWRTTEDRARSWRTCAVRSRVDVRHTHRGPRASVPTVSPPQSPSSAKYVVLLSMLFAVPSNVDLFFKKFVGFRFSSHVVMFKVFRHVDYVEFESTGIVGRLVEAYRRTGLQVYCAIAIAVHFA